MQIADYGLATDDKADVVLVEAETVAEAVARPTSRRRVFKRWRLVAEGTPP